MNCRHCGYALSLPSLGLGNAPPSNAYLDATALNLPETWYSLCVEEARAAKRLQAGMAGGLGPGGAQAGGVRETSALPAPASLTVSLLL